MSVDAIEKLDEDTIITGSSDGIIRVLSVQPHRLLGVLAQQEDGGCERIALSPDHRQLVTTSYGTLRLWDTSCLDEDEDDGTSGPSLEESEVIRKFHYAYREMLHVLQGMIDASFSEQPLLKARSSCALSNLDEFGQ